MISILSEPMVKVEHGPELSISLDPSNKFPVTTNCVAKDTSWLGEIMFKVLSKLNPNVTRGNSEVQVVTSNGGLNLERHKYILWGCQITNTNNINTSLIDARCLTGPNSYKHLKREEGRMFDARLLIPWAFDIPRSKEYTNNFCLIPGEQDLVFLPMKDRLETNGITVVDPNSPIEEQMTIMSKSMVVLTSLMTHFLIADGLGVPVHPFLSRGSRSALGNLLSDYYSGSGRHTSPVLDFSKSISVNTMTTDPGNIYDLNVALGSCPLEISPETVKSIKEYFNAS